MRGSAQDEEAAEAVSYTHLDVYKRQAHRGYDTPLVGQGTDVGDIQTGIQQIVRLDVYKRQV